MWVERCQYVNDADQQCRCKKDLQPTQGSFGKANEITVVEEQAHG